MLRYLILVLMWNAKIVNVEWAMVAESTESALREVRGLKRIKRRKLCAH